MIPGTLIFLVFGMCHSKSDSRFSNEVSITSPANLGKQNLDIHDALGHPVSALILRNAQSSIGRALNLDGRLVPCNIHLLAPRLRVESLLVYPNFKAAEQHFSRCHFIDECIEPVGE